MCKQCLQNASSWLLSQYPWTSLGDFRRPDLSYIGPSVKNENSSRRNRLNRGYM